MRILANPSVVMGMVSAIHADPENSCFCNNDLKSLQGFTRETNPNTRPHWDCARRFLKILGTSLGVGEIAVDGNHGGRFRKDLTRAQAL